MEKLRITRRNFLRTMRGGLVSVIGLPILIKNKQVKSNCEGFYNPSFGESPREWFLSLSPAFPCLPTKLNYDPTLFNYHLNNIYRIKRD